MPLASDRWWPRFQFCKDSCISEGAACLSTEFRDFVFGGLPDQCCPGTVCTWISETETYPFDDKEGYFCVPK